LLQQEALRRHREGCVSRPTLRAHGQAPHLEIAEGAKRHTARPAPAVPSLRRSLPTPDSRCPTPDRVTARPFPR
jgi:hypothetical protein